MNKFHILNLNRVSLFSTYSLGGVMVLEEFLLEFEPVFYITILALLLGFMVFSRLFIFILKRSNK